VYTSFLVDKNMMWSQAVLGALQNYAACTLILEADRKVCTPGATDRPTGLESVHQSLHVLHFRESA
jgi:hypothetical protein